MPATQRKEEPETDLPWPDFDVLDGGGKGDGSSTPERDSVRGLNDLEQNPDEAPSADEDIGEREESGGPDATPKGDWEDKTSYREYKDVNGKTPKAMRLIKKKGPMAAIIGLILGGGSVGTILLSPGFLLFHLKETLFDDLNYHNNAMHLRTNKVVYHKFKQLKRGFAFDSDGHCGIRCKFGTISRGMKDNLEAQGFKLKVDEGKGVFKNRYVIKELTSPNTKRTVTNAKDFDDMMNNAKDRALINKILRYKTMYFLNTKYGRILKEKFGINKLSKLRSDLSERAKTKSEAYRRSLRKALGLPETKAPPGTSKFNKIQADPKIQKALGKISSIGQKATGISSFLCGAYSVSKSLNYVIKYTKYAAFVVFAYTFLTEIDKIKAGDADPDTVSQIGDQFTALDLDGKSATDSVGYKMSAYGSVEPLSESDKETSLVSDNWLIGAANKIASKLALTGTVIATMATICLTANVAGPLLSCLTAAGVGSAATPAGAIAAYFACVGIDVLGQMALGVGFGFLAGYGIKLLAEHYMPLLDDDTIGGVLGNVMQAGTNQAMGGASSSYGLSAATNNDAINQYGIDTSEIRQQEQEIAVYEAKDTPFDIYNRYSFLGSIISDLHLETLYGNSSPASVIKNFLGLVPRSIASLNNSVNAIPSQKADGYYDQCDDPSLKQIGIEVADAFCNPYYIMSSESLALDTEDVLDYMIENDYIIEETGEPNPDSKYQKYLDNCANRQGPIGDTDEATLDSVVSFRNEAGEISLEDAKIMIDDNYDYGWKVGLYCIQQKDDDTANQRLNYFSAYTADFSAMETIDDDAMYTETAMEYKEKGITFYEPDDYQSKIAQELREMQQAWEYEDQNISDAQNTQQKQQSVTSKKPAINIAKSNTCNIGSFDSQIFDLNILCGRAYPGIVKKQGYAI